MDKKRNNNDLPILSSLLYMRSELRDAEYYKAESFLSAACLAFLEDWKLKGTQADDLESLTRIIEAIKNIEPEHLEQIIDILDAHEPLNDNQP